MSANRERFVELIDQTRKATAAPSARSERIFRALTSRGSVAICLLVFALGVIAFLLLEYAHSSPNSAALPAATVARAGVPVDASRVEVSIVSEAASLRLVQVLVDVGSNVRRGDLLARGDDARLLAQLAQQDTRIQRFEAELVQALADVDSARRLRDNHVYRDDKLQARQATVEAARAGVLLARAQRRELEIKLAQLHVVAPAAGVIVAKSATVGDVVPQGTELFRLVRDTQVSGWSDPQLDDGGNDRRHALSGNHS